MEKTLTFILLLGTAGVAGFCFAWPAFISLKEIISAADWSAAALTGRQWGLLFRGLGVAAAAAVVAQLGGAALAVGLAAGGRGWLRALIGWLCAVVLLTPPYLYAYAWGLVLLPGGVVTGAAPVTSIPPWLLTTARAVWCLAAWTAPLAAGFLYLQWRSTGRPAYALTLLDAGPWRAFWRGALPVLWPGVAVSFLLVFMVNLTEYSVTHLCLVQTWNTEILAEVQVLGTKEHPIAPGQALLLAWPLLAAVALPAALLWPLRQKLGAFLVAVAGWHENEITTGDGNKDGSGGTRRWTWNLLPLTAAAFLALPLLIFATQIKSPAAFARVWETYPNEWPNGLGYALASALLGALLAVGADFALAAPRRNGGLRPKSSFAGWARLKVRFAGWREQARRQNARELPRTPRWACPRGAGLQTILGAGGSALARGLAHLLFWTAGAFAAAPPALVGDAFKAAYLHAPAISDHWPILALVMAARFAFFIMLALRLAGQLLDRDLTALAATDGASRFTAYFRVRLPLCGPALGLAAGAVGLLSLTEVAASSLVSPPGTENLAVTLLNAIHFGRNDAVIAMSLYLMAFVAVVTTVATAARRWFARRG